MIKNVWNRFYTIPVAALVAELTQQSSRSDLFDCHYFEGTPPFATVARKNSGKLIIA